MNHKLSKLGVRLPFVGAPMAGTSTPELAAAVSNAGGLGSLGMAGKTLDEVRSLIRSVRALTKRPFNVNFFCHREPARDPRVEREWIEHLRPLFIEAGAETPVSLSPSYATFLGDSEMLDMLCEERPAVVSFHFGSPDAAALSKLHNAGIFTMASATSTLEVAKLVKRGIGAIVAQGIEAGGHRSVFDENGPDEELPIRVLLQRIRHEFPVLEQPVVAAGGIMDHADAQAVFRLGADAVQVGTALVVSPESAAPQPYRKALAAGGPTRLTSAFSGRPARGLVTRFMEHAESSRADGTAVTVPSFPIAYSANKALPGAAPYWAGQGVGRVDPRPAAEVVLEIMGCVDTKLPFPGKP